MNAAVAKRLELFPHNAQSTRSRSKRVAKRRNAGKELTMPERIRLDRYAFDRRVNRP